MNIGTRFTLGLGGLLFIFSCQSPIESTSTSATREVVTVGDKKVVLISGVRGSDLNWSFDETVAKLTNAASTKLGRSVSGSEPSIVSSTLLSSLFQETVDTVALPNFENPSPLDFERVKSDFPDLDEQEIAESWMEIRKIYLDQLAALTTNRLVKEFSDGNVEARGVYSDTFKLGPGEITIYELAVAAGYPLSALNLLATQDKAYELVSTYMGCNPKITEEKSDAFRHSVWTQTLAKMGWGLLSEKLAWAGAFSFAHELGSKYDSTAHLASDMDWHNNTVGLEYYVANSQRTYSSFTIWWLFGSSTWTWESGVNEPSYEQLAAAMRTKAKDAVFVDNKLYGSQAGRNAIQAQAGKLVYIEPDSKVYP